MSREPRNTAPSDTSDEPTCDGLIATLGSVPSSADERGITQQSASGSSKPPPSSASHNGQPFYSSSSSFGQHMLARSKSNAALGSELNGPTSPTVRIDGPLLGEPASASSFGYDSQSMNNAPAQASTEKTPNAQFYTPNERTSKDTERKASGSQQPHPARESPTVGSTRSRSSERLPPFDDPISLSDRNSPESQVSDVPRISLSRAEQLSRSLARSVGVLSDESTSSSENESMSSDSEDVKPIVEDQLSRSRQNMLWTPPIVNNVPPQPHKIGLAREAILAAYSATAVILDPPRIRRKGTTDQPWKCIKQALAMLSVTMEQGKIASRPAFVRTYQLLLIIVQNKLIPLTADKQYVKSIAKSEAKTLYPLLRIWAPLEKQIPILDITDADFLANCPQAVLGGFAKCALNLHYRPYKLDLSGMGLTLGDLCGRANLAIGLRLFGAEPGSIDIVDLANNHLTSIPKSLMRSFAKLRVLDLRGNPLETLPLTIFRVHSVSVRCRLSEVIKQRMGYFKYARLRPPPSPVTLLEICALWLLRYMDSDPREPIPLTSEQQLILDRYQLCEICDSLIKRRIGETVLCRQEGIELKGIMCNNWSHCVHI